MQSTSEITGRLENVEREIAQRVVTKINDRPVTVADLRAAFERVENRDHWKNAWSAEVAIDSVAITLLAVEWFHGRMPRVEHVTRPGFVQMSGDGYAC